MKIQKALDIIMGENAPTVSQLDSNPQLWFSRILANAQFNSIKSASAIALVMTYIDSLQSS